MHSVDMDNQEQNTVLLTLLELSILSSNFLCVGSRVVQGSD